MLHSEVRTLKVGHKEASPFKVPSLYRVFYCHARYVISLLNLFFPVAGDLPAIEAVEFWEFCKSSINVRHALISLPSRSLNEIANWLRRTGICCDFMVVVATVFFWLCKYVLCVFDHFCLVFCLACSQQAEGCRRLSSKILFYAPQYTAYAYCVGSRQRRRISYYCLPRGRFVCPGMELETC